jgi:hypothetical protein
MVAKHPLCLWFVVLVLFSNQIFFRLQKLNLFLDLHQKFVSRCLPMALTIAPFIGLRYANIRWRSEEDVYTFGIQGFWGFHFESDQIFKIVSSLQYVQRKIPAAFINFDRAYLLNRWSYEVAWIPVGKNRKSSISLLFNCWSEYSHNSTNFVFSDYCS